LTVSLSFVLPVRNAEKTVAKQVQHLLDVLSELTERFEILLMDEGSTDHTPEVARDLQRQFPQVRVAECQGPAARQAGLQQAAGAVVVVEDAHRPIPVAALRRALPIQSSRPRGELSHAGHARGG
jgi:glycosyltransferase involved in cell wall biosynthesis